MTSHNASMRQRAFTLMELLISVALLSMVMVIVTMSLDSGSRFNDRFTRQTDINNEANRVLNKLAMQLRMAGAGNTPTTSLELPGGDPIGFQVKDPSKPGNVKAYYFAVSKGLGPAPGYEEQYEPYKRMIIYDYSVVPGRLILQTRDADGNPEPYEILTEDVAEDGFNLVRIGNTLQMTLTLRSQTRVEEDIIYTAFAQTLFLRSTLNESSGSSPVSSVKSPVTAEGVPVTFTSGSPSVMFGNLVTVLSTSEQQVSIFVTAPIGKKIDPKSIIVSVGSADKSVSVTVDEGASESVDTGAKSFTVVRTTFPPASKWPSPNGTYSITLNTQPGELFGNVGVTVSATTTDGEKTEAFKQY